MSGLSFRRRVELVAVVVLLLALVVPAAVGSSRALAQGVSTAAISPTQGPAGTKVTGTGNNWPSGDHIQAIWDGPIGTYVGNPVVVNSGGGFTLTFSVPAGAQSGSHVVSFWDSEGRYFVNASTPFDVRSINVERVFTTDADGREKTAFVTGYAVHYRYLIRNLLSTSLPVTIRLSATGPQQIASESFPFTAPPGLAGIYTPLLIPDDARAGTYTATVTVTASNDSASGKSTFGVTVGKPAALTSPFSSGVHFHVISTADAAQGYVPGGYDNVPPGGSCTTGTAPDHCRNQLFALDLLPAVQNTTSREIHAPVPGTIRWRQNDCLGMDLGMDGLGKTLNLTLCHFGTFDSQATAGRAVTRGQLLGTRSTNHIHMNLDYRPGTDKTKWEPVPFTEVDGGHTFMSFALNPNHDGTGESVSWAGKSFKVERNEWGGIGW